jgi:hypothetical protein
VARALILLALLCATARADSPKLAEARQAVTDVRYDDAQRLLSEALRDGNNSPAAVAEIYKLAASTAVVLDQHDVAERYYERWLALDPTAQVPTDLAPKLREPFIAAQAAMQSRGSLDVRIQRVHTSVDVVVANDPLAMAVSVAVGEQRVAIGADRRAQIVAPPHATLIVLDDSGNHLRELPVPDDVQATPPPPPPPPQEDRKPLVVDKPGHVSKGWLIGTAVSGAVFLGFGAAAIAMDGTITEDLLQSESKHLDDVDSAYRLERVFIGVTIVSGAAMIACAIPLTSELLHHKDLWIAPTPGGFGLTIGGAF